MLRPAFTILPPSSSISVPATSINRISPLIKFPSCPIFPTEMTIYYRDWLQTPPASIELPSSRIVFLFPTSGEVIPGIVEALAGKVLRSG